MTRLLKRKWLVFFSPIQSALNDVPNCFRNDDPNDATNVVPDGVPNGVSNGVPKGFLNGVPNIVRKASQMAF